MFLPETGRKELYAKSVVLPEPVLVGREREFEELQRYIDSVLDGKGATVFVSGEAGSGKTRLTSEFLNVVKKKGVTVLAGWCLSNAAVPYFPFVEAFDTYLSGNEAGTAQQLELKSWLMGSNQAGEHWKNESLTPQVWKDQTFASITKELLFLSTNKPTILFIDDIHWADSASLSLLHYISRAINSERILIIATFRTEELNAPAEGQVHPLIETLRLMKREDLFKEIKLANLDQINVGRIAENMLGGSVHPEFIEKLAKESQGNPLFIVESLRLLSEHGNLVQHQSQWRLSIDKLDIPTKVKDIILRRVSALKSDQRSVLDVASVVGDLFDPELLGAVLNQDSLQVLETLNAISQSNSLVCCEKRFFRFDHAKSREVIYEEIRPPLRTGYHGRIAERIEKKSQDAKMLAVSDLAYHYAQAGNIEKSVKYSLAAGKDALDRFSNSEAIKHFNYVLHAISETQEYAEEKRTALEGLGDALCAGGMFEDGIKIFERIINTETGIASLRAYRKAVPASFWRGDAGIIARVLGLASKVMQYAALDRLETARILMWKGKFSGWTGNTKASIQELEGALQVFEEEYSLPDVASALYELAHKYAINGQIEKGVSAAQRSIAIYEDLKDIRGQMNASLWAGVVFGHQSGFVQEALDWYGVAIKIGEKIGDFITLAWGGLYRGALLESVNELELAVATSLRGLENAGKTNSIDMLRMNRSNLTRQYTKLGDLEHAEKYFEQLVKDFPDNKTPGNPQAVAVATWSKAVFYAAKNQWNEANECFETSLKAVKTTLERVPLEAWIKADYAQALEKQGRIAEAKAQHDEAQKLELTYEELGKRLKHADMQTFLIAPKETEVGTLINMRLDIVNIGKNSNTIIRIKNLIPSQFKVSYMPINSIIHNNCIEINERKVGSFQVKPVKVSLKATKAGVFRVEPEVVYINDLGENKTSTPEPVNITVKPTEPNFFENNVSDNTSRKQRDKENPQEVVNSSTEATADLRTTFEFKTESAQKTFDFLITAFVTDYMRRRIVLEKAGWRTLMEIVKDGKISTYSVYGEGRRGTALIELERRGLVETRIFPGERGRGGKILKARVCYDKDPVKRQVDRRV